VRRAAGISQAHMAFLLGYKYESTVARFERHGGYPTSKRRRALLAKVARDFAPEASLPYAMALAKGQQVIEFE